MKKKVAIIISIILIVLGLIICGVTLALTGFDFSRFNTTRYTQNTYTPTGEFNKIYVKCNDSDINLIPSDDGTCKVVCCESKNMTYDVSISEDTLFVKINDRRKWYEYITFFTGKIKMDIYLPEDVYESIQIFCHTGDIDIPSDFTFNDAEIKTSTGDISFKAQVLDCLNASTGTGDFSAEKLDTKKLSLETHTGNITANEIKASVEISAKTDTGDINFRGVEGGKISIKVSTGDIKFTDVKGSLLTAKSSTGSIKLDNVIISGKTEINVDTGDVKLLGFDAEEIKIDTDTGDVSGTILSEKIFITETDTGSVNVPHSTSGGKCEISTDTGDIKLTIKE